MENISKDNVLEVANLNVFYNDNNSMFFGKNKKQQVVYDASFSIAEGEILGLVGESGCGKSSLSKAILGINTNITGSIVHKTKRPQMIFQDPYSSLNPVKTVGWILEEPLKVATDMSKSDRIAVVHDMIKKIGLSENYYNRRPRELSGGERQRISIGQALIVSPKFVIADEPVSALDVTIQAQIMDLMLQLQQDMNLAYLFISHDVDVIYQMCDRLMVMKEGHILEMGDTEEVFANPEDEYTKLLLA